MNGSQFLTVSRALYCAFRYSLGIEIEKRREKQEGREPRRTVKTITGCQCDKDGSRLDSTVPIKRNEHWSDRGGETKLTQINVQVKGSQACARSCDRHVSLDVSTFSIFSSLVENHRSETEKRGSRTFHL